MNSQEWYSTPEIVEAARKLMGGIDLDPCSSAEANEIVKATRWYGADKDGLTQDWNGRVFVNPPGGLVLDFWEKLMGEYATMRTFQAVWVGYSLEQFQTLQASNCGHPLQFDTCIPKKRIAFTESTLSQLDRRARCEAKGKPFNPKSSPSHGNYLTYLGPQVERFREIFGRIGVVR